MTGNLIMKTLITGFALLLAGLGSAQAFEGSNSTKGWGGVPGGPSESAAMHATGGVTAGQVQAKKGLTSNSTTNSNYAIGVQNLTSINGDHNSLNASQGGTVRGSTVKNQGQISGGSGGDNLAGTN